MKRVYNGRPESFIGAGGNSPSLTMSPTVVLVELEAPPLPELLLAPPVGVPPVVSAAPAVVVVPAVEP